MTQVVKTEQAASVPNSRPTAGMRNIAMIDRMEVEELSPPGGVTFNDASYLFRDFLAKEGLFGRKDSPPYNPGSFNTPSQTFAALFQANDIAGNNDGGGSRESGQAFAGLLSRAVSVYEANARVIGGAEKTLGTSLSMIL